MVVTSVSFGRQQNYHSHAPPAAFTTLLAEIAALPGGGLASHGNVEYAADVVRRCAAGQPQLEGALIVGSFPDDYGNLITMACQHLNAATSAKLSKGKAIGQRIIHAESGESGCRATIRTAGTSEPITQTFSQVKYTDNKNDVVLMERHEDADALPNLQARRDDTSISPERPIIGQYIVDLAKEAVNAYEEALRAPAGALVVSGDQGKNHLNSVLLKKNPQEKTNVATLLEGVALQREYRINSLEMERNKLPPKKK